MICQINTCAVDCSDYTYIVWVPGGVCGGGLDLNYNVGQKDDQQQQRTDAHPAHLPEQVRTPPSHELNLFTKPTTWRYA